MDPSKYPLFIENKDNNTSDRRYDNHEQVVPVSSDQNSLNQYYSFNPPYHQAPNPMNRIPHQLVPPNGYMLANPSMLGYSSSINPMVPHYLPFPYTQYPTMSLYQTTNDYSHHQHQVPMPPTAGYNTYNPYKRKAEPDNDDEDDDGDDEDDTRSINSKLSSKKSVNVRENSKYQREKRKAYVQNLEVIAKELSEGSEHHRQKLEEDYDTLNIIHQTLKLQSIAFIQLLFHAEMKEIHPDSESRTSWPDVLENPNAGGFEVIVPALSYAYKPPPSCRDGMLRLTNASEILSYTSGLRIAYEAIARKGTNICDQLKFHLKLGKKSFISKKNVVSLSVTIESYNAKLLGGTSNIIYKVFGTFTFSQRSDGDRIVKAQLYYNSLDIHRQLSESFSPRIYRPITLNDYKITGEPSSLIDVAQFIANMEDEPDAHTILWRVTVQNDLTTSLIGDMMNKTVALKDGNNICRWIPQSMYMPAIQASPHHNSTSASKSSTAIHIQGNDGQVIPIMPSKDIFVQLFPYLDDTARDISKVKQQVVIEPNRLFAIIHRCRYVAEDYLALYLIYDFLEKILDMYDHDPMSDGCTSRDNISHVSTSSTSASSHTRWQQPSSATVGYPLTGSSEPEVDILLDNHQHDTTTSVSSKVIISGVSNLSPLYAIFSKAAEIFDMISLILIELEHESEKHYNEPYLNNNNHEDHHDADKTYHDNDDHTIPVHDISADDVDDLNWSNIHDVKIGDDRINSNDGTVHSLGHIDSISSTSSKKKYKHMYVRMNSCIEAFMAWISSVDHLQGNNNHQHHDYRINKNRSNQDPASSSTAMITAIPSPSASNAVGLPVSATGVVDTRRSAMVNIRDGTVELIPMSRTDPIIQQQPFLLHNHTSSHHNITTSSSSASTAAPLSPVDISVSNTISNELQQFFVQIRESQLISRLISMLRHACTPEEVKNAEGFLFLCWTRHVNPTIHNLLSKAKIFISNKQYDEALHVTSQIIAIDPMFAEGYNKRATVYFGLRRPQECFKDLDMVLLLEPNHYGAYCGRGLMLMKIADFSAAIKVFYSAIKINPALRRGGLSKTLAYCHARVVQSTLSDTNTDIADRESTDAPYAMDDVNAINAI